jgi:hypothetical protein
MTDDAKHDFDAYTKLADYWADSYERRRQVEWKISLGFWAVILSGVVNSDKLHGVWSSWFAWLSLLAWAVYVILWLVPNMQKNERDKRLSCYYLAIAVSCNALSESAKLTKFAAKGGLLGEVNVSNPATTPPLSWLRAYSIFFHAITTALLLFGLNYIMYLHRAQ